MTDRVHESFFAELEKSFKAPILRQRQDLEPFARDFSGLQAVFPLAVASASEEGEVVRAFEVAARHGKRVTLRGAGHSVNGQALSAEGLVLKNFEQACDAVLDPSTGHVDVSARSSWFHLQEYLVSHGRSCPVLTDFLLLSVGGTLSIGGYGARSIANGAQIDNVERLRLVLPNGHALWCSRTENFDLFRLALAGQGAVGCIERALLRTIARRYRTRIYGFDMGGLRELAESLQWLETWTGPTPDWFVGAQRFRPAAEFTVAQYGFDYDENRPIDPFPLTPPASQRPSWIHVHERAELQAHTRTIDLVEGHPDCVRMWSDYMFGYASFVRFAEYVEGRLREARFRAHLSVIGLLIHRSPDTKVDFPFEVSSSALGRHKYMVGFYFFVPTTEVSEIEYVHKEQAELLARCLSLGGRPYRYGIADMDRAQQDAMFGAAREEVASALSRHGAALPPAAPVP